MQRWQDRKTVTTTWLSKLPRIFNQTILRPKAWKSRTKTKKAWLGNVGMLWLQTRRHTTCKAYLHTYGIHTACILHVYSALQQKKNAREKSKSMPETDGRTRDRQKRCRGKGFGYGRLWLRQMHAAPDVPYARFHPERSPIVRNAWIIGMEYLMGTVKFMIIEHEHQPLKPSLQYIIVRWSKR